MFNKIKKQTVCLFYQYPFRYQILYWETFKASKKQNCTWHCHISHDLGQKAWVGTANKLRHLKSLRGLYGAFTSKQSLTNKMCKCNVYHVYIMYICKWYFKFNTISGWVLKKCTYFADATCVTVHINRVPIDKLCPLNGRL